MGGCVPPQCSADADCNTGPSTGNVCKQKGDLKVCVRPCTDDAGCTMPATCSGVAADSTKFCAKPECATDTDCGSDGKCTNGTCTCTADSFCAGAGKCMSGACVCAADADCTNTVANHCAL
jgi:hypothetical protein